MQTKKVLLTPGHVYYLRDFTAPKYWNGEYFECLLTDQKVNGNSSVVENLGHIENWPNKIYKPERFNR